MEEEQQEDQRDGSSQLALRRRQKHTHEAIGREPREEYQRRGHRAVKPQPFFQAHGQRTSQQQDIGEVAPVPRGVFLDQARTKIGAHTSYGVAEVIGVRMHEEGNGQMPQ